MVITFSTIPPKDGIAIGSIISEPFPVDESTGKELSDKELEKKHIEEMKKLKETPAARPSPDFALPKKDLKKEQKK